MKKRILASTFFCLVVLSLTACNSNIPNDTTQSDATTDDTNNVFTSTDTNSEFTPLDIAESGYTMIEGGFLYCSVKVHNPNTDLAVLYPTVRITARDSQWHIAWHFRIRYSLPSIPNRTSGILGSFSK